jgi:hypothetical protein
MRFSGESSGTYFGFSVTTPSAAIRNCGQEATAILISEMTASSRTHPLKQADGPSSRLPNADLEKKLARLRKKAAEIHLGAANLSTTYGIFRGVSGSLEGYNVLRGGSCLAAIHSILFDLLHIMAVRVCALMDVMTREDDASVVAISEALKEPTLRAYLVAADKKWRGAIGQRATQQPDVARSIANLQRLVQRLRAEHEALSHLRHFRNKRLAHLTTGHDSSRQVLIGDLWRLTRVALRASRHIRLVFYREEGQYPLSVSDGRANGRALGSVLKSGLLRRSHAPRPSHPSRGRARQ